MPVFFDIFRTIQSMGGGWGAVHGAFLLSGAVFMGLIASGIVALAEGKSMRKSLFGWIALSFVVLLATGCTTYVYIYPNVDQPGRPPQEGLRRASGMLDGSWRLSGGDCSDAFTFRVAQNEPAFEIVAPGGDAATYRIESVTQSSVEVAQGGARYAYTPHGPNAVTELGADNVVREYVRCP